MCDHFLSTWLLLISPVLQGDKVRQLKAAKAEKAIVTAAVAELLDLKKRLAASEEEAKQTPAPATTDNASTSSADLENLTRQVAEQVEFVLI